MKNSFRKRLFYLFLVELVFLFFGMTTGLFAQNNEWSLRKCLEYAIENSLEVQQSQFNIEAAKINTKQSKHDRYPNLSSSTGLSLNFGRTVDPTTNDFITTTFLSNSVQFNSNVLLFNAGRLNNTIRSNANFEKANREDLNSVMIQLAFDIARNYFAALLAQENVANLAVQIENTVQEIERMNKMIEAGTRARAEIYDLEAQKATSEQEYSFAQNNYGIAMVNLKALMNIQFGTEMNLVEPKMDQIIYSDPDAVTFEEAFKRSLEFSPSNKANEFRIKAAELDLEISMAGGAPSLFAGGNVNTNYSNQAREVSGFSMSTVTQPVTIDGTPAVLGSDQVIPQFQDKSYGSQFDDNLFYGFGVNLSIPIYSNYQTKANVERSKVNLESLKTQKLQGHNNLRNTIQQMLTDARGAKRVLEASEKTLEARRIASENAQRRFDVGALNSYDYISIKNQYNQAQINLSIAKYDYIYKVKILDYYQGYPVEF